MNVSVILYIYVYAYADAHVSVCIYVCMYARHLFPSTHFIIETKNITTTSVLAYLAYSVMKEIIGFYLK